MESPRISPQEQGSKNEIKVYELMGLSTRNVISEFKLVLQIVCVCCGASCGLSCGCILILAELLLPAWAAYAAH